VLGSKLYATWIEYDATLTPKVRVSVYAGDDTAPAWTSVDGDGADGLNEDPLGAAMYPDLCVLDARVYATWQELGASGEREVKVAVYGGDDAAPTWTFVHGAGETGVNRAGSAGIWPQLAAFASRLYLTWVEGAQVRVAVYGGDDGAPAWARVDGGVPGVGLNAAETQGYHPRLTAFGARLYAAWSEDAQVRVAVYGGDDAAPSWSFVDGRGLSADPSALGGAPQLAGAGGRLYAAWIETNGPTSLVRAAVFNGDVASPVWALVDGADGLNRDPSAAAEAPQLAAHGARLYAAWAEKRPAGTGYAVHVAVYGGDDAAPTWTFVDGGGTDGLASGAAADAGRVQLVEFDARLYAAWREIRADAGIPSQVRVAVAPF
jgi:hypothetical protein